MPDIYLDQDNITHGVIYNTGYSELEFTVKDTRKEIDDLKDEVAALRIAVNDVLNLLKGLKQAEGSYAMEGLELLLRE